MKIDVHLQLNGVNIEKVAPIFVEAFSSNSNLEVDVFPRLKSNGFGVVFVSSSQRTATGAIRDIIAACPKRLFSKAWRSKMAIQCVISVLIVSNKKSLDLELGSEEVALAASIGGSIEFGLVSNEEFRKYKRALS